MTLASAATAACDPAAAGSPDGPLDDWMRRWGPELHRHLTGMLGEPEEAEDLLQEVWLTAHERPPALGETANVRAWLYRVATNKALDRLARDRRRAAALSGRRFRLLPDSTPDPDAGLLGLDERARTRIRRQVARLPRKQREAVWLRWIEGSDYAAIAARLDCSQESARANVYNGMKRLRRELFDLWKRESRR